MPDIKKILDGKVILYTREKSNMLQARIKIDNKLHRISCKTSNVEQAEEVARQKYAELNLRRDSNIPVVSKKFKHVAELAIKQMKEELDCGYGKVTYKTYIFVLNLYHIPFFGNTNIDNIDHKKLKDFDVYRLKLLKRTPAASTLNNHNSALNYVFNYALDKGWMFQHQVPHITNKGKKAVRRPYFNMDEYRLLTQHKLPVFSKTGHTSFTRELRELMREYVLILANTGMRPGEESLNLKWNQIEVFKDSDGESYLQLHVDGKTGKRGLIAKHSVLGYLMRIRDRFDNLKDLSLKQLLMVDEYVFRTKSGNIPSPSNMTKVFEKLLKESNLLYNKHGDKRTLYSLRHTYATINLLDGVDIHVLSRQMGTSIKMIELHYSHLVPKLKAKTLAGKKFSTTKGIDDITDK